MLSPSPSSKEARLREEQLSDSEDEAYFLTTRNGGDPTTKVDPPTERDERMKRLQRQVARIVDTERRVFLPKERIEKFLQRFPGSELQDVSTMYSLSLGEDAITVVHSLLRGERFPTATSSDYMNRSVWYLPLTTD